jgi:hypothetical protein
MQQANGAAGQGSDAMQVDGEAAGQAASGGGAAPPAAQQQQQQQQDGAAAAQGTASGGSAEGQRGAAAAVDGAAAAGDQIEEDPDHEFEYKGGFAAAKETLNTLIISPDTPLLGVLLSQQTLHLCLLQA